MYDNCHTGQSGITASDGATVHVPSFGEVVVLAEAEGLGWKRIHRDTRALESEEPLFRSAVLGASISPFEPRAAVVYGRWLGDEELRYASVVIGSHLRVGYTRERLSVPPARAVGPDFTVEDTVFAR